MIGLQIFGSIVVWCVFSWLLVFFVANALLTQSGGAGDLFVWQVGNLPHRACRLATYPTNRRARVGHMCEKPGTLGTLGIVPGFFEGFGGCQ